LCCFYRRGWSISAPPPVRVDEVGGRGAWFPAWEGEKRDENNKN